MTGERHTEAPFKPHDMMLDLFPWLSRNADPPSVLQWIPRRWRPGIQMETVLRLLRSILASDPAQANTVAASASALELEGQTALRLAANKETTVSSGAIPRLRLFPLPCPILPPCPK